MQALRTELRALLGRVVEKADDRELYGIITALFGKPEQEVPAPAIARAGAPWILEPRFEIVSDDVALDRSTDLEWTRRNVTTKSVEHAEAVKACEALELAGGRWRLPTIKELLTLVDYERHEPAIDTGVFTCASGWYWTSTPYAPSPGGCAWFVYFYYGHANYGNRGHRGFVRAVRASQ